MQRWMLNGKLHGIKVTETQLHYEGSIGIDQDWIEQAGFLLHEQVHVLNLNTGQRLITYVIEAPRGSKTLSLNGAAARTAQIGDPLIVLSYTLMDDHEAQHHQPRVVLFSF